MEPMLSGENYQVFCHSGHEYAERPTAFMWDGERLTIERVTARWRTPQGKCFLVQTGDGSTFTLQYDEISSEWLIQPGNKPAC